MLYSLTLIVIEPLEFAEMLSCILSPMAWSVVDADWTGTVNNSPVTFADDEVLVEEDTAVPPWEPARSKPTASKPMAGPISATFENLPLEWPFSNAGRLFHPDFPWPGWI